MIFHLPSCVDLSTQHFWNWLLLSNINKWVIDSKILQRWIKSDESHWNKQPTFSSAVKQFLDFINITFQTAHYCKKCQSHCFYEITSYCRFFLFKRDVLFLLVYSFIAEHISTSHLVFPPLSFLCGQLLCPPQRIAAYKLKCFRNDWWVSWTSS